MISLISALIVTCILLYGAYSDLVVWNNINPNYRVKYVLLVTGLIGVVWILYYSIS